MDLGHAVAVVMVHDLERSLRFYRDVLGLTVEHEQEDWVLLARGVFLLLAPEPIPQHELRFNTVGVAFTVDDIEAAYRRLTEQGTAFMVPPTDVGGALVASFQDPDGNLLQLLETRLT